MTSKPGSIDAAARQGVGRRRFLQLGGLTLGGAALAPLVNAVGGVAGAAALSGASSAAEDQDPDEPFQRGWFREADRGYRRLLRGDPNNAHALARRGYIALLSNEFEAAETFLTRAIELAPDDTFSKLQLADTFVRQDQLARAVPLLQGLGETERAWAVTYVSISGTPYDVHGADSTTVQFPALDPLPHFDLSVNGMEPQRFIFDTGATLNLTKETAQAAGLVGLATSHMFAAGQQLTLTHGVADSIRIGEAELRNVPLTWPDQILLPELPDGKLPAGVVGTDIFYRFLTTLDYADRSLVLRRKTTTELERFRTEATRAGAEVLPLWLATDHLACTLGSLNDYGPRVVLLDTGAFGLGVITIERFARESGIELGDPGPGGVYQVVAEEISLGDAVGSDMPGLVRPDSCPSGQCPLPPDLFTFEVTGAFAHEFYKPFAVTLDFVDMNLYITGALD
jgi:Aspartyl protease